MASTEGLCIFVCLLISIIGGAHGLITLPPSNAVESLNGQIVLHCESSLYQGMWFLSKNGIDSQELFIVGPLCTLNAGFEANFGTDTTGGTNACNLIVKNITMEQAGVYRCLEQDSISALLTVIDSFPNTTFNNTEGVAEHENVIISCTLNYNGSVEPASTLRPHFYWTDINGQNVSSSYDSPPENSPVISQLTVTAGRQHIIPYRCHVSLYLELRPPTTGGYANNTPTVNISASSPTIAVLYSPLISTISSKGRNDSTSLCEISTVTCEATANPTANYTWIDLEEPDYIIIYNQSYRCAEFGRNYNCSATNIIRTTTYTDAKTHEERNEYSTRPPCKGCHASTMNITGETCTDRICSCLFDCNMTVTCTGDAYPEPTYEWIRNGLVIPNSLRTLDALEDGNYSCVAKNVIDGCEFTARIDVEVVNCSYCGFTKWFDDTTVEMTTTEPPGNETTPTPDTNEDFMIIVGVVLVYEIANLISMGFFLAYYNIDSDRNTNENNGNLATHKKALNNRFPWLERMLPCMNQSHASAGKKCLWIFLFSLITISCGVFIFPILIIIVKCCGTDLHGSQENSQLNLKLDDMSGSARGGNRFPPPPSSLPPAPRLPSTSAAGLQRPIPPPNKPTRPPLPAMTHQMNREGGAAEYAFLPLARRPHLAPAQYLDDDETSHYAILRRV